MQPPVVVCYILLAITVTASCAKGTDQRNEIEESDHERRITKRDATVLINGFPQQYPTDRAYHKPKVIYRRISKQRYGPPHPKSRPPRPSYGPPKLTRKPGKKYKSPKIKHISKSRPNYSYSNSHKKRISSKPRYGPPKSRPRPNPPPSFNEVVKKPHHNNYYEPDGAGFGEPPIEHINDHRTIKQSYAEPPVDSYGAPLIRNNDDTQQTAQSTQEMTFYFGNQESDYRHEYQTVKHPPNFNRDTAPAFSKTHPKYKKTENSIYITPTPEEFDDDEDLEPDTYTKPQYKDKKNSFRQKKPHFADNPKVVNKPRRPDKNRPVSDEVIVGGQYAEPPARYVPKFQPSAPMYDDDDESFSPKRVGFVDLFIPTSAYKSPYVNYKNSNLAFSPQNLNDAFSIVDK